MLKDIEFRKNLIVSIVTSVLVLVFIEPLLKWSGAGIMWLGANISESFTKSVYASAALGLREKYSFMVMILVISGMSGVIVGVTRASHKIEGKAGSVPKSRRNKYLLYFLSFTSLVSGISSVASNFIELQLNASFNQRITVLAAKVSDQQVKELRAAWALMGSRKDYESINEKMNQLANSSDTKLPVALWQ